MLNVSANHLAKVETGSRCCSIELLQDLSSCLNVRTDYLLNGDAPHNNHLRERLTFLAQELEKITADLPVCTGIGKAKSSFSMPKSVVE